MGPRHGLLPRDRSSGGGLQLDRRPALLRSRPTDPGELTMATPIPTDAPEDRGSEQTIEQKAVAGLSQGALVRRRFFRHKLAMTALVVLVFIILLAFTSVGTVIGGTGSLQADAS